jgi:hypothetical protein
LHSNREGHTRRGRENLPQCSGRNADAPENPSIAAPVGRAVHSRKSDEAADESPGKKRLSEDRIVTSPAVAFIVNHQVDPSARLPRPVLDVVDRPDQHPTCRGSGGQPDQEPFKHGKPRGSIPTSDGRTPAAWGSGGQLALTTSMIALPVPAVSRFTATWAWTLLIHVEAD